MFMTAGMDVLPLSNFMGWKEQNGVIYCIGSEDYAERWELNWGTYQLAKCWQCLL